MTFKNLGDLSMILVLFISRKTHLCLPLPQIFEKAFAHENNKRIHLQTTKLSSIKDNK